MSLVWKQLKTCGLRIEDIDRWRPFWSFAAPSLDIETGRHRSRVKLQLVQHGGNTFLQDGFPITVLPLTSHNQKRSGLLFCIIQSHLQRHFGTRQWHAVQVKHVVSRRKGKLSNITWCFQCQTRFFLFLIFLIFSFFSCLVLLIRRKNTQPPLIRSQALSIKQRSRYSRKPSNASAASSSRLPWPSAVSACGLRIAELAEFSLYRNASKPELYVDGSHLSVRLEKSCFNKCKACFHWWLIVRAANCKFELTRSGFTYSKEPECSWQAKAKDDSQYEAMTQACMALLRQIVLTGRPSTCASSKNFKANAHEPLPSERAPSAQAAMVAPGQIWSGSMLSVWKWGTTCFCPTKRTRPLTTTAFPSIVLDFTTFYKMANVKNSHHAIEEKTETKHPNSPTFNCTRFAASPNVTMSGWTCCKRISQHRWIASCQQEPFRHASIAVV